MIKLVTDWQVCNPYSSLVTKVAYYYCDYFCCGSILDYGLTFTSDHDDPASQFLAGHDVSRSIRTWAAYQINCK